MQHNVCWALFCPHAKQNCGFIDACALSISRSLYLIHLKGISHCSLLYKAVATAPGPDYNTLKHHESVYLHNGLPHWDSNPSPKVSAIATEQQSMPWIYTFHRWRKRKQLPSAFERRWNDWLHMTSMERHVSLCFAIRNVLLSVESRVMPQV